MLRLVARILGEVALLVGEVASVRRGVALVVGVGEVTPVLGVGEVSPVRVTCVSSDGDPSFEMFMGVTVIRGIATPPPTWVRS